MPASTPPDEPRKRRRPELSPAQRALGLLVRREHSRKELARKLAARGVSREDASEAVARMTAEGWQDDARFAESLARMRAAGGHGPVRIRAELETHGLEAHVIAQAFRALADAGGDDWLGRARLLVHRRYGADRVDDLAIRRKAADFLIRRGFDAATAYAATRSAD
jgi:regulatory protein